MQLRVRHSWAGQVMAQGKGAYLRAHLRDGGGAEDRGRRAVPTLLALVCSGWGRGGLLLL